MLYSFFVALSESFSSFPCFRAPLTLERVVAASVMGSAETSATTRRIDPAADLREAMERNAQEKRNEEEAARLEKAEADKAEASAKKKLAEAEAVALTKRQAEEAVHRQSAVFITPLNSAPPPPEFTGQTGEAGRENPIMEKEGGDSSRPDVIVPPPPPSAWGKTGGLHGPLTIRTSAAGSLLSHSDAVSTEPVDRSNRP